MGKKQKIRPGAGDLVPVPGPLDKQIEKSRVARHKMKIQKQIDTLKLEDELPVGDDQLQGQLNEKFNAKIVKLARKQWTEEEHHDKTHGQPRSKSKKDKKISLKNLDGESSDEEGEEDEEALRTGMDELENELLKISADDEEAVKKFLFSDTKEDIQGEINKKKVEFKTQVLGETADTINDLNPEVVLLYKEVGEVLAKYRSGKIPKAFKMIPSMVNWEDMLFLTCPENWSSGAMLQATRLFSSCMSPAMCQRFYNVILLPRIRDEIGEYKKLNFHMYQCLFKAMYKPAAFFKGILLPLCDTNQPTMCTLREAWIVGSVLRKVSIPVLHAAAAMLKISEMDYYGPNSYILRILIEKRYTLPFRAIDGLVFHFLRMRGVKSGQDGLPVLWHQALLSFVQIYKRDMSSEQREALLDLIKTHNHYQMTPEIRRHLQLTESRNEESEANIPEYAKDDMEF
ncbi:bystin domain-containing protein [Ditylenchus destructor]|uniref:Bystin domain-containing protein n=1 Tax=Ditylenchus destructor TaxID=166010 RepID=A0AAD4N902_9BILA|nr:bystin domain-containing protein [Ditylenchus destructor]